MTGEMYASEVTREAYPQHFAIADEFNGEVKPFDQYQGPYICIGDDLTVGNAPYQIPLPGLGVTRLWLTSEDGCLFTVHNEKTDKQSRPFLTTGNTDFDNAQAVEGAHEALSPDNL